MLCSRCLSNLPEKGDCVSCSLCTKVFHYTCSVRETKWRNMSTDLKNKKACVDCKVASSVNRMNSTNSYMSDMDNIDNNVSTKALLLRELALGHLRRGKKKCRSQVPVYDISQ